MPYITVKDGTQIYYKDWGSGPVVTFSHGWPLCSDAWEAQMLLLAERGFRCVAHDRRGHGRSGQPWKGNEMDTYADDLLALFEHLDLKGATMVGHSTGGGEVARFIGRHGSSRVAKAVLVSSVPPLMLKTPKNPLGLPMEVFSTGCARRSGRIARSSTRMCRVVRSSATIGRGQKASQGLIDAWWLQGMMAGHKNTYDCIKAFSETDFTDDLKKIDVPVLVIHGDDDQIVPIEASAKQTVKLVKKATLKIYPGGAHGLTDTAKEQLCEDLLAFIKRQVSPIVRR